MSLMFLRGTSAGATDQQHKHEERRRCHRQVEQLTGDKRQRRWGPDIHVSFNKCSEAGATVEQRWMGTSKKFTGGNGITVGTAYQRGGGPLWKYNHATTRGAAVGFTPSQLGSDVALNYDRKKKNFNHLCSLGFIVLTATSPPPRGSHAGLCVCICGLVCISSAKTLGENGAAAASGCAITVF